MFFHTFLIFILFCLILTELVTFLRSPKNFNQSSRQNILYCFDTCSTYSHVLVCFVLFCEDKVILLQLRQLSFSSFYEFFANLVTIQPKMIDVTHADIYTVLFCPLFPSDWLKTTHSSYAYVSAPFSLR